MRPVDLQVVKERNQVYKDSPIQLETLELLLDEKLVMPEGDEIRERMSPSVTPGPVPFKPAGTP